MFLHESDTTGQLPSDSSSPDPRAPRRQADEAQMRQFLNTVFKRCGDAKGWVALRAFEHEHEGRIVVNTWAPFGKDLLPLALDAATEVANRDGDQRAVFSPPVAIFGEQLNEKGNRVAGEANVICAPAIAVELDKRPQESLAALVEVLGEPTITIASGGMWEGQPKLHAYWRLGEPARTDEEKAALKDVRKMATRLVGGDKTAVALSHPMRWPGSWHTKAEPRLCKIVGGDPTRDVKLAWAVEALNAALIDAGLETDGHGTLARADRKGFKTEREWPAEDLDRAAALIPNNDVEWDDWSLTGMAFYDASHASADGLEAFIRWSEKSTKGDADAAERRWQHWSVSPPTQVSAGKLVHLAREVDPTFTPSRPSVEEWFEHLNSEAPLPWTSEQEHPALCDPKSLFDVLTIDQIFSRPDPEFLINRHVPEKSIGFLYGDPGTGKSFIALDWALHVAFDRADWFGDPIRLKPEGCVVYIAGEGASGFKSRVSAWLHRRGISAAEKGRFGLIHQSVDFMSPEAVSKLVATLRQVVRSPVAMIVVDTVSRAMAVSADVWMVFADAQPASASIPNSPK